MKTQVTNPYLPLNEYIPDGEPRIFGDRLYVFGSHDRFDGEFYCLKDYAGWSAPTDDLTEWKYEGIIYEKNQDPLIKEGLKSSFTENREPSMFAPDVVEGADGRYYMFYGIDFVSQVSVAVCDTPCGIYKYYGVVKYPDGTIYGQKETDAFLFDPGVLVDDNKKVFLYTGFSPKAELIELFNQSMNINLEGDGNYVVELEKDMLTVKTKPVNVLPGWKNSEGTGFEGHEFFEASSIRKFNSLYYLIYSSILSHELAYAISRYPDRDFQFGGSLHSNGGIIPGVTDEETNYWGNNHGSIQKINNQYYIFGHRQTNYTEYSRQGTAEKLFLNEDGSFEFAEMTSCGLNDGPLKAEGHYSSGIACELYAKNGAMKSISVSSENREDDHPCITQEKKGDDDEVFQYIKNIKDGTVIGFKYFHFKGLRFFSIVARGKGEGILKIKLEKNSNPIAEIGVASDRGWHTLTTEFSSIVDGTHSLYLEFEGEGCIDLKEFAFHIGRSEGNYE